MLFITTGFSYVYVSLFTRWTATTNLAWNVVDIILCSLTNNTDKSDYRSPRCLKASANVKEAYIGNMF